MSGCGSGQPGDLTVAAEKVLVPKVQQVRDVAATGNITRLRQVVRQLETLVRRELADGQVSQSRGQRHSRRGRHAADRRSADVVTDPHADAELCLSHAELDADSHAELDADSHTAARSPSSSSPSPGTTVTIGGIVPH